MGKLTRAQRETIAQYRGFREADPDRLVKLDFIVPEAVMVMGPCEFIGYRTTHGKKSVLYTHDFAPGSRPLLCAGSGDNELYLLGGRYRVTDRGIVDLDGNLREILDPSHGKRYK